MNWRVAIKMALFYILLSATILLKYRVNIETGIEAGNLVAESSDLINWGYENTKYLEPEN